MSGPREGRSKALLFAFISIVIALALIELAACLTTLAVKDQLFSSEDSFDQTANATDFSAYVASPYFDPRRGWDNPKVPTERIENNCLGEPIAYHYRDGYRLSAAPNAGNAQVYLFGDSYAHGDEVPDDATIASQLVSGHGISAVNFGVPGYGTDQAVEKFKGLAPTMPTGSVAVLLVQHENIRRVVNSFRPVYSAGSLIFGLKPYVLHGTPQPLDYPKTFAAFMDRAHERFAEDYWAKPVRQFPYTLALAQALLSRNFAMVLSSAISTRFSYEYGDAELRGDLQSVILDFVRTAVADGIRPLVVFVPLNRSSYGVSSDLAEDVNRKTAAGTAFEFADDAIDWRRYNLKANGDCHPSAYGYGRLADFVAARLAAAGDRSKAAP